MNLIDKNALVLIFCSQRNSAKIFNPKRDFQVVYQANTYKN